MEVVARLGCFSMSAFQMRAGMRRTANRTLFRVYIGTGRVAPMTAGDYVELIGTRFKEIINRAAMPMLFCTTNGVSLFLR
jgi:hypothetical protein